MFVMVVGYNPSTIVICSNKSKHDKEIWDKKTTPEEEPIPIYYSYQHAYDEGWRKTKDIHFCPPNKSFVWICPDCAKEFTTAM